MLFHESYAAVDPVVAAFIANVPGLYRDGRYVAAHHARTFTTFDPSTGQALAEIPRGGQADIDATVDAARAAFDRGPWRTSLTPSERGNILWRFADLIEKHGEILAQLDSLDNGLSDAEQ
jgi:acyl-CoA reductase-like NAD-dependent aldehyde dehydrogenase